MKKKLLSLALALALSMGLVPAAFAANTVFTDVPSSHWAHSYIQTCASKGIVSGIGNDRFSPDGQVTYAQFCSMIINAFYPELLDKSVSGPWYAPYMNAARKGGLLTGTAAASSNYFADVPMNRYDMAQAAANVLFRVGKSAASSGKAAAQAQISDWSSVPRDYCDAVTSCYALGILSGFSDGSFGGSQTMTRAQACVVIVKLDDTLDNKAAPSNPEALGTGNTGTEPGGTGSSSEIPEKLDGVSPMKTAFQESKEKYLRGNSNFYVLKNNGALSVLQIRERNYEKSSVQLETYRADGTSAGIREIPMELGYCAAFYESDDSYYLAFGQDNMEENDNKEVYRVVRYNKNWKRLGAASVTGKQSYTTVPYSFTSHTAMAEEDGTLILHASRQRYLTSDGLRHQSNITITVRTSDMSVLSVSAPFPSNHVSHSFAQYVAFDNGNPVYVDHGDSYPRGFTLNATNGKGSSVEKNFFPFSGKNGDNTTNAISGGFGVSADNYIFAGASSPQKGNDSLEYCNTFLAVVPKKGYPNSKPEIKWLTSLPANGKEYVASVQLVPMNNNTFVVMWQTEQLPNGAPFPSFGAFHYAVFDGKGNQIGRTMTKKGYAAPVSDPTVSGGKILWVRPQLDYDNTSYSSVPSEYLNIYELEIDLNPTVNTNPDTSETPTNPVNPTPPNSSDIQTEVDFSPEYMSSKYYRQLKDVTLTGDYRHDMLAVALSQIGYCEGNREDQLDGSHYGSGNYTEYGRYLGSNGSAWCSEFASWCARVANVPTDILGSSLSARVDVFGAPYYTWDQTVYAGGGYTPQPGDLVLFAWYGTRHDADYLSHTAMVYDVKDNGNTVTITTIDGNSSGAVRMNDYTARKSDGDVGKGDIVYFVSPDVPFRTKPAKPGNPAGSDKGTGTTTTTNPGTSTNPWNPTTPETPPTYTDYKEPTHTPLPADGRVDLYRREWGQGSWLELEVLNGDTIRFTGCIPQLASYYNYAVIQVIGDQQEVPIYSNVPFEVEAKVDVDRLNEIYGGDISRATNYVTAMVCQNHTPGKVNLAGFSFSGDRITLALNGRGGCTLQVVVNE